MGDVEPSSVNAHERGGGGGRYWSWALHLPAESTAGVELAGKVEKAIAAKHEALIPWAQDKAERGREVETPPHEGRRKPEALRERASARTSHHLRPCHPECRRNLEAPPQKRKLEADALPQRSHEGEREPLHEDVPSTWEGAPLGTQEGSRPGSESSRRKGPSRPTKMTRRASTPASQQKEPWPRQNQSEAAATSTK